MIPEEYRLTESQKEIRDAVLKSDEVAVEKYLAREPSLLDLKYGVGGESLLHIAVRSKKTHMVDYFLEKGIDINVLSRGNRTPLSTAFRIASLPMVKHLLAKGASIQKGKKGLSGSLVGEAVLYRGSIQKDVLSIVKYLVEDKGELVTTPDRRGRTPLHEAARRNNVEVVRYLISKGASVDKQDRIGYTPLHFAAMGRKHRIAKLLIANGADVNTVDNDGQTPLHLAAARRGNLDVVKVLVRKGGKKLVAVKDKRGRTALYFARRRRRPRVAKYLRRFLPSKIEEPVFAPATPGKEVPMIEERPIEERPMYD
jgi:ankyrin repeat protein